MVNSDRAQTAAGSLTGPVDGAVQLDAVSVGVREGQCPGVVSPWLVPLPGDTVNVQALGEPRQRGVLGLEREMIESVSGDELDRVMATPPAQPQLAVRTALGGRHADHVRVEAARPLEVGGSQTQV